MACLVSSLLRPWSAVSALDGGLSGRSFIEEAVAAYNEGERPKGRSGESFAETVEWSARVDRWSVSHFLDTICPALQGVDDKPTCLADLVGRSGGAHVKSDTVGTHLRWQVVAINHYAKAHTILIDITRVSAETGNIVTGAYGASSVAVLASPRYTVRLVVRSPQPNQGKFTVSLEHAEPSFQVEQKFGEYLNQSPFTEVRGRVTPEQYNNLQSAWCEWRAQWQDAVYSTDFIVGNALDASTIRPGPSWTMNMDRLRYKLGLVNNYTVTNANLVHGILSLAFDKVWCVPTNLHKQPIASAEWTDDYRIVLMRFAESTPGIQTDITHEIWHIITLYLITPPQTPQQPTPISEPAI